MENYTINITFGDKDRVNNISWFNVNQDNLNLIVGCAVEEHKTRLLIYSNATYDQTYGRYKSYNGEDIKFTVKYQDIDVGNANIVNATYSNWSIYYGGTLLQSGLLTQVNFISNPGEYSFTLDGSSLDSGKIYEIVLQVGKNYPTEYVTGYNTTKLYVQDFNTSIYSNSSSTFAIPWGNNFSIFISYNDTTNGQTIDDAVIASNWDSAFYSVQNLGGGQYKAEFNTTRYSIGTLDFIINASKANYTTRVIRRSVYLRPRNTKAEVSSLIPVPYGNDSIFYINYQDLDNNSNFGFERGINNGTNGNLTISFYDPPGLTYVITPTATSGRYMVIINGSNNLTVGNHEMIMKVNWANEPFYENQTIQFTLTIREIDSAITLSYPPEIPWGNYLNVSIYYQNNDPFSSDYLNPIEGANINISTLTFGVNYTVYDLTGGYYILQIFNNTNAQIQQYNYQINVSKENHTTILRDIQYDVVKLNSFITIDPIGSIPLGNDVNLTFQVKISDYDSLYHNNEPVIGLGNNNFTITSGTWIVNQFSELGNGYYSMILRNSSTQQLTTYEIKLSMFGNVTISSSSRNSTFSVRQLKTRITYTPVTPPPFNTEFNISIRFFIDDQNSIVNGQPITNSLINCSLNSVPLVYGLDNDYVIYDVGNGYYEIQLNGSLIPTLTTYSIRVNASHYNINQFYDNSSIEFSFSVASHQTSLTYISPSATPVGDWVNFSIFYIDTTDGGTGIDNDTNSVIISAEVQGFPSTPIYTDNSSGGGQYDISIDTSNLLKGTHYVTISVNYISGSFYLNQTKDIPFELREIYTGYYISFNRSAYVIEQTYSGWHWGTNNNVTIYVTYYDTDHGNQNITHPNIELVLTGENEFSNPSTYSVSYLGYGTFKISINSSVPQQLDVFYRFNVTLRTSSNLAQENYSQRVFDFRISWTKPATFLDLEYSNSLVTPWGHNISIFIEYIELQTEQPITIDVTLNINITINDSPNPYGFNLIDNASWVPQGNGFNLTMNTSSIRDQDVILKFEITASNVSYQNATSTAYITVRNRYVALSYISGNKSISIDSDSFNLTVNLVDLDESNLPIVNNSQLVYENVSFYVYFNGTYNRDTWEYGNFTVSSHPIIPGYYNFSFTFIEGITLNNYEIDLRVNGSHIGSNTADKLAKLVPSYFITIKLKVHQTNITINLNSPDFPDDPLGILSTYPETVEYGQSVNFTFFWYDLNASATLLTNQSGIEKYHFSVNVTNYNAFGDRLDDEYIVIHNLYDELDNNIDYKGVYVVEILTAPYQLQPYRDMIGKYNITITMDLIGSYETEYNSSSHWFNLTVTEADANLQIIRYADQDGSQLNSPIIPWVESSYYFRTYVNYTTDLGVDIGFPETVNVTYFNGTHNVSWTFIFFGGSNEHRIDINTFVNQTINANWVNGFKNYTVHVEFQKTNYKNVLILLNFSLQQHYSHIEIQSFDNNITYKTISYLYVRYVDDNYTFSSSEHYVQGANLTSNWTYGGSNGRFIEISPGLYSLAVNASASVLNSPYYIQINATDLILSEFRRSSLEIVQVNIEKALLNYENVSAPYNNQLYHFEEIILTIDFETQFHESLTSALIMGYVYDSSNNLVKTFQFIRVGGNRYSATIPTNDLMPGIYTIVINATDLSGNFEDLSLSMTIRVQSLFEHPLVIILSIIGAVAIGLVSYRQIKWWRTPYPVKKMIKTKKAIEKHKEIDLVPRMKSRNKMFESTFNESWATLNLKPAELVSQNVVKLADTLSNVKRSRVTSEEAKSLMNELKSMSLDDARKYLETSLMIPPAFAEKILTYAGLIKEKDPKVVEFKKRISELKKREFSYDDCEDIINRLKIMKLNAADNYLWKSYLISTFDRIDLLKIIGFNVDKLIKRARKEIPELTEKQIKGSLARIPGLSLEEKAKELENIMKLDPKSQRTRLDQLKSKYGLKIQRAKEKVKEKEKKVEDEIQPISDAEIDRELSKIKNISEEDRKLMKESISLMSPEDRRETLKELLSKFKDSENNEE
ncbi:MAG: hypothetical protein ACTSX4_13015 [Candidatus Helarchaeota archaeon]